MRPPADGPYTTLYDVRPSDATSRTATRLCWEHAKPPAAAKS